MRAWGITDVGLKRRENQDTYAFETFGASNSIVAVVCDGMGGVSGGRLASGIAVETFMEELRAQTPEEIGARYGVGDTYVRSILARTRKKLKKYLKEKQNG